MAFLLEIDYSRLTYHLFGVPPEWRYATFEVPRKSGKPRRISAPATALKIMQKKLNEVLQAVYEPKVAAHGFVRGRHIRSNALSHTNQRWVLNLDLEDFFPSIHFGRVLGLFQSPPYSLPKEAALTLARICCHEGALPQGAPTSPVVSNMICVTLDRQLLRLAEKHRSVYSRYADDITFSTSLKGFPAELATLRKYPAIPEVDIGRELRDLIKANSFRVNEAKVRLRRYDRRQEVTGLTVNSKLNVSRAFVRKLRAMLHAWRVFDYNLAQEHFLLLYDRKHRRPNSDPPAFERVVGGMLEFLGFVRGKDNPLYLRLLTEYRSLMKQTPYDALWVLETDPLTAFQGTGFDLEGHGVVTCHHVLTPTTVAFRADSYTQTYPVRVLREEKAFDLAVVEVEADDLPPRHALKVATTRPKIGDAVKLLGFPTYAPGHTVHEYRGEVAGLKMLNGVEHCMISAPIRPGNSGGPVLNTKNEVIGVARTGGPQTTLPAPEYGVVLIAALAHLQPKAK